MKTNTKKGAQLFWAVANPSGIVWPMTVACFPELARDRLRKCWRREGSGDFDWQRLSSAGWSIVRVRLEVLAKNQGQTIPGQKSQSK